MKRSSSNRRGMISAHPRPGCTELLGDFPVGRHAFRPASGPRSQPPFPRIGNTYAAQLASKSWEEGQAYWSKLGLIIGGGYDLHYDWDRSALDQASGAGRGEPRQAPQGQPADLGVALRRRG